MSFNKYGHPNPRSNWRHIRRGLTNVRIAGTKPPYDGAVAHSQGWPCVPPYQMKARAKARWCSEWLG